MHNSAPAGAVRRKKSALLPRWLVVAMASVAVLASAGAATFAYSTARRMYGRLDGSAPEAPVVDLSPLTSALNPANLAPASTPVPRFQCGTLTRTVTVLVMGIDQRRNAAEQGPYRTDTMIVLSLDPLTKRAAMLSIPRDLWVTIPDYGAGRVSNRINTANMFGDAYGYPGGGPALATKTAQLALGIPIDHYVRLNFTAFEDFIDLIGGIDVVVPEDIYDPKYPTEDGNVELYQISAGQHHLDGVQALKYARTRRTVGSDFDRADRQQQVIYAVRDKVMEPNRLPQLLARAPELAEMFADSVQTDFTANEVACLAQIAQDVPRGSIRNAAIDEERTAAWITPEGWEVLVPQRDKIAELMLSLFGTLQ